MVYITRIIEEKIKRYIESSAPPFHVLLLNGARQCGKSTLLTHLFPKKEHFHINLALEGGFCDAIDATGSFSDFTFLLENRLNTKMGGNKFLIFDEAQLSRKLGSYVRFMKEEWKTQRVILTGSTLSTLFDNSEKPTGRVVEFILRPFNFVEFLAALGKEALLSKLKNFDPAYPPSATVHEEALRLLKEYLTVGGLPEVVLTYKNGKDFLPLLADIFSFYKRDFQEKLSSENLTAIFTQVFLRIAAATGSPIKLSSIIKSSSPGYKKVQDVLSLLEAWHQVIRVDSETSRLSKIGTVTPKRYLFDHGIRFLQNPARFKDLDLLDTASLHREETGGVIENFAATELLSLHSPFPLRSWSKTNQSGQVDFLFQNTKESYALEVKAALKLDQKHLSSLFAYQEFYPKTLLILANLSSGGIWKKENKTVLNIPAYALYSFLETGMAQYIGCMKGKIKIKGDIMSTGIKWDAES